MSNHPSRSRRLFYGVDRKHATPHRSGRGHGRGGPVDFHKTAQRTEDRRYFARIRDLFRKPVEDES